MPKQLFRDTDGVQYELPEGETVHWRLSAYGVLEKDGKTLMIKDGRGAGDWEFPGGGVEIGESFIEAVTREFFEETGYKIRVIEERPLWIDSQAFYSKIYKKFFQSVLLFYRVELVDTARDASAVNVVVPDEISAMEWVSNTELTPDACHPMTHGFLKQR